MATVSGSLRFDKERTAQSSANLAGIANVPVVLQNTQTNAMLAVLTDANGNYTFTNVPDGSYRIVEKYGEPAAATPGDFSAASIGAPAEAVFPPISAAPDPPAGATNLDATTPTTLLVTVSGSDLTGQDILNGPVTYTPIRTIMDTGVVVLPQNLITKADNGTFGSFTPGTPANTGANPNPYPDIGTQFNYALPNAGVTPAFHEYTIQNIMSDATPNIQQTWWRIADHTSGNETGRMMIINGDAPGSTIFEQQVTVKPNTYYLMSSWILNLAKNASLADPQLGVAVLGSDGQVLYNATLGALIGMNPNNPEWKQIGTVINSQSNTSLTIRFTSEGPEAFGNDYAIDDIALNEVQVPLYIPQKSASASVVNVGDTVRYTITLAKSGMNPLTGVTARDAVPDGFTFVPGSVEINGVPNPSADPNAGFSAPDVPGDGVMTITFNAVASRVPSVNPAINNASVAYSYTPVKGGIADKFDTTTNDTAVEILQADLAVTKTASPDPAQAGGPLQYTVVVRNNGPTRARDVVLSDPVPANLGRAEYSTDGGATWQAWSDSQALGEMAQGAAVTLLFRGIVSSAATDAIRNTATVSSPTSDPNRENNSATVLTPVDILADVSILKTAQPGAVQAGGMLTYTLRVSNAGPSDAQAVSIADAVPAALSAAEYSTDNGLTWQSWSGTYTLGTMTPGAAETVLLRGRVQDAATGTIRNTAQASSPTPDPNQENNSATVLTVINVSADLAVAKSAAPATAQAGSRLTYTLTVTNNGPSDAQETVLRDNIPASLTGSEYSVDGGATWQAWTGSHALGTVTRGASVTVLLRGVVNPSASGTLTNTVTVESATPDPDEENNSALVTTPVISSADLSVVKRADPSPAIAGSRLTYTLTVTNNGPSDARGVSVTDHLPASLTNVQYSLDDGVTWQAWTGSYTIGNIARGTSVMIPLRGDLSGAAFGTLTNIVTVGAETPDPNDENNTATVVTPVITSADMAITKTADPSAVQAGGILTYRLTVVNNGPNDAREVSISDTLPSLLTAAEYSTDEGATWQTWSGAHDIGTVTPGSSASLLIRAAVSNAAFGTLANTAAVSSATPDSNEDNNRATVVTDIITSADMALSKTAAPSPVQAGSRLTYTLTVTNRGPNDAQEVSVSDDLSSFLTEGEYSADNGLTWQTWSGTHMLGTMRRDDSVTLLIRGTVSNAAAGSLDNTAQVSSTTPDPDEGNNHASIVTPIITSADMTVTKTASPSPVQAGGRLTYTLTVKNNGPNDARQVSVSDSVPSLVTGAEYSADNGATWQTWTGSQTWSAIARGTAVTLLIRGTVDNAAAGELTNTAAVSSETPDPDEGNNSTTIVTPVTTSADVAVVKTAAPSPVRVGDKLTYTLTVSNNGPNDAQAVTVSDNLPALISGAEYSADGGVTWQTWNGSYAAGTMARGASATLLLRGTVSSSASGTLTNTAQAASTTPDPNEENNSASVMTPINTEADIAIVKTAAPSPVQASGSVTYTLSVSNNGPGDAQNVLITDDIPDSITGTEYSLDGGVTWQAWNGSYEAGTMARDTSLRLLIRGTVSNAAFGTLTNTARAASATPDPNEANNSVTVVTPITAAADLMIAKTASPSPVQAGGILTYTLTASNRGPNDARDVLIADDLPSSITAEEYSADNGVTWQTWRGSYGAGTVARDTSVTLLIRGTVSNAATGMISNTAAVSSATPDPNEDDNSAASVVPVITSADIAIVKTAGPSPVQAGGILTYTLTVTNNGPNDAQEVSVSDDIPSLMTGAEYSADNGMTWQAWNGSHTLGKMARGESATLLLRGTVSNAAFGTLTNTARAAGTTPDPNEDNNSAAVLTPISASADIAIAKEAGPSPVQAGGRLTYTLTVTNRGPNDAQEVTVSDDMPSSLAGAEYSTDSGVTWQAWNGSYPLGMLARGASAALLLRGTLSNAAAGTLSNTAAVSSTTPDPDADNNRAVVITPIVTSANIALTKSASPSPVQAGGVLTYTLAVTNNGPNDAQAVTVSDSVPAFLTGAEYSADEGRTWQTWNGSYTVGTMTPNASSILLLRGTVSNAAHGSLTNTAQADSTTPDPNEDDNRATVTTPIITSADISVTKRVVSGQQAGGLLTYEVIVTNNGPNDAREITVSDQMPSAISRAEYSTDGGVTWAQWSSSYVLETLAMDASVTLLLRGVVSNSAVDPLTNTVQVSSTTPDPDESNNSAAVVTPVETSADIVLAKTADPSPVSAGRTLTYTLVVTNRGPNDARQVVITDSIPALLAGAEYSADGGQTWQAWSGSYTAGTMEQGSSATLLIRGTVSNSAAGTLTNTAKASSTTPDPDESNNSATATTPVVTAADMLITKSAAPSPVPVGDRLTYTLTVTNRGPNDAQEVQIADDMPSVIEGAEYSQDGGQTWQTWSGTHTLGTIAPDTSATILIRGTVSSAATGTISNTAKVSSVTPDPDSDNNSQTVLTPIMTAPYLMVSKTAAPSPVQAGGRLTYTITVTNNGPNGAEDVRLTDPPPPELSGAEYSADGGLTWQVWSGSHDLGVMAEGASATILIRADVSNSAAGNITNTATVSRSGPDPDPENNSATVVTPVTTSADLTLVKTAGPSPVQAGGTLTYTLTVKNNGPNDAREATVSDPLPASLRAAEFSTDAGVTWQTWSGSYSIGTVKAGASAALLIRASVSDAATGTVINEAEVRSTTPDPNQENNRAATTTPVTTSADLAIAKTVDASPVAAGKTLTYTLTVKNNGPNDAQQVSVTDAVPSMLTGAEYTADGGQTWQAWDGSYTVGTMPRDTSATVLIRGIVSNAASGTLTNMAAVTSVTPDPDETNNSTSVTTPVITSADIAVTKRALTSPAPAGGIVSYILTVTNSGPNDAQNVAVEDALPAWLQGAEYSIDSGAVWQAWSGSYAVGIMAAGTSADILIRGTLSNSAVGTLTNQATVSSSTPDPDEQNNSATVVTPVATSADLALTKSAEPSPVQAGGLLTYTLILTNRGPNDAQEVALTDNLPSALTGAEYSADGGAVWNTWSGSYAQGTLARGASITLLIRGTLSNAATGSVTNTALLSSTTPDPNEENNSATVVTPIVTTADLAVTKRALTSPAPAGGIVSYILTVTNNGPNDAQNVAVEDALPASLQGAEYSIDNGAVWQAWSGSYAAGSMAAGASADILIRGTLSNSAVGTLTNTVKVSSATPDPNEENNSATVVTPIVTSADLTVTKSAEPSPVQAGGLLTYTLVITNRGPNDAQAAALADNLPSALTRAEYSVDEGNTWEAWSGSYALRTMAAGASAKVLIRGVVSDSAVGTLTNTAEVSSQTPDPNAENNSMTVTTPVLTEADLMITKSVSPSEAAVGSMLTYTLVMTNRGPNDAQDAALADNIPPALTGAEFSVDDGITWQAWSGSHALGRMARGASVSVLIRGTVSGAAGGTLANTATVSSTTPDPDKENNSASVVTPVIHAADLAIVKTALPSPAQAGNLLTYTIGITNNGPSDAQEVSITDDIPDSLTEVEYSADNGLTWQTWSSSYMLGTLARDTSVSLLVRGVVTHAASGTITNTAQVKSLTRDPNEANNTATVVTPLTTSADLTITKTVTPSPVQAGATVTYTLAVMNNGPNDAQDVVVSDDIPQAVTGAEYSADGGQTWQTWSGSYAPGTLTRGTSLTVLIRGTVNPSFAGELTNKAVVGSATPDPNEENNSADVTTPVVTSADMAVTKSAAPTPAQAGKLLTYSLRVTNNGPNDAQEAVVEDEVPKELERAEFSTDGGQTWAAWNGSGALGTLERGKSALILVRGIVSHSAAGTLVNKVTTRSVTPDPDQENNEAQAIAPVVASADLSVTKSVSLSPAQRGDLLTYTLTVTNSGPDDAQEVLVRDVMPEGLERAEYSTDGGTTWRTWSGSYVLGTMEPGTSQTVLIRAAVSRSAVGTLTNTVTVSSPTPDPDEENNSAKTVTPILTSADLAVVKTARPSPVRAGSTLTYTLTVTNRGADEARNVSVSDDMPSPLTGAEYSTDGGTTWRAWNGSYTLETMARGESVTILIRAQVDSMAAGSIVNTAKAVSQTPDPNEEDNSATVVTPVFTSADLAVAKTAAPNPAQPGHMLTYTLTLTNNGPNAARDVRLADAVPSSLSAAEYSADAGAVWRPWDGFYAAGTMEPGASVVILIRGMLSDTAAGTLTNSAQVTSSTPDPQEENNIAVVITPVDATPPEPPEPYADLSVEKTVSPCIAAPCDTVIYKLVVRNAGPEAAEDTALTDEAADWLTNVMYSLDSGRTWNPWSGLLRLGTLPPDTSVTIWIKAVIDRCARCGIVNVAKVYSPTRDENLQNNRSEAAVRIQKRRSYPYWPR